MALFRGIYYEDFKYLLFLVGKAQLIAGDACSDFDTNTKVSPIKTSR